MEIKRIDEWIKLLNGIKKDLMTDYGRISPVIDEDIECVRDTLDEAIGYLKDLKHDYELEEVYGETEFEEWLEEQETE